VRALSVLALLAAAGCFPPIVPSTPDEAALDLNEEAEYLYKEGRYAEAMPKYETIIKARDQWKAPYLRLARCYEVLGRRDDAVATVKRLLAIDRFDEQAQAELLRLEAQKKG
jgi:tetratricopeptide (TPR) repeat protein